jgi:hypothetical protein
MVIRLDQNKFGQGRPLVNERLLGFTMKRKQQWLILLIGLMSSLVLVRTSSATTGYFLQLYIAPAMPAYQQDNRPNIIVIITDDLDANSAAFMPNLQSLLVDQGLTFSNMFVSQALCCPSRASIFTGQFAPGERHVYAVEIAPAKQQPR